MPRWLGAAAGRLPASDTASGEAGEFAAVLLLVVRMHENAPSRDAGSP